MIGVGESTARQLEAMGVYTIGQLAQFDRRLLGKKLGKHGDALWQCANGEDRTPVALETAEEEIQAEKAAEWAAKKAAKEAENAKKEQE